MSLSEFTKDMGIIAALDDEPNDVGGLSAAELKDKFDEGGKAIQEYLNSLVVAVVNAALADIEALKKASTGAGNLPTGGTTGQVPYKAGTDDYNVLWGGPAEIGAANRLHASQHKPGGSDSLDADYLPLAGGTMTGNLAVKNSYPVISAKDTTSGRSTKIVAYPAGTGGIENYADASNCRGIRFNTEGDDLSDAVQLVQMKEGAWSAYDILHTGNRSALGIPKCVTGTYTGTGTYGADNPCSLTFDFAPKMVILLYSFDSDGDFEALFGAYNTYHITMFGDALTTEYVEDAGFGASYETQRMYGKRSEDGKTFSWYAKRSAAFQYNVSGTTYTYLAIGYEGDDV